MCLLTTFFTFALTAVIAADGQLAGALYTFGCNNSGQLGLGLGLGQSDTPKRVTENIGYARVRHIALGDQHLLILLEDGEIFGVGNTTYGRCGLNNGGGKEKYAPSIWVPMPIIFFDEKGIEVSSIYAGGAHSLAVTTEGICYAFGNNGRGQLGLGHFETPQRPTKVSFRCDSVGDDGMEMKDRISIVMAACASDHSLFLDANGRAFACGYSQANRLGDGETDQERKERFGNVYCEEMQSVCVPVQIKLPLTLSASSSVASSMSIVNISSGGAHSFAITSPKYENESSKSNDKPAQSKSFPCTHMGCSLVLSTPSRQIRHERFCSQRRQKCANSVHGCPSMLRVRRRV